MSLSVVKNCVNDDSYGCICVLCNACGRFDKSTQKECYKKMLLEKLQKERDFNDWSKNPKIKILQQSNIKKNIKYYEKELKKLKELTEVKND